jgi:4-carboxymuconolactone decarboxylase
MKNQLKWQSIFCAVAVLLFLNIPFSLLSATLKDGGSCEHKQAKTDLVLPAANQVKKTANESPMKNSNPMEKRETAKPGKSARITPMPVDGMTDEWKKTLDRLPGSGLKGLYSPVNVFGTLMYNTETMGSFLDYWVTTKLKMSLSGREQEMVILRMGYLYQSNYVWKHHVPVAQEYGVSDEEINHIRSLKVPSLFNPRETALLMLTNEMVEHRTVREEVWSRWSSELNESEMIDLISLVSQYVFFALLNNSIQIEVEEPLTDIPGL